VKTPRGHLEEGGIRVIRPEQKRQRVVCTNVEKTTGQGGGLTELRTRLTGWWPRVKYHLGVEESLKKPPRGLIGRGKKEGNDLLRGWVGMPKTGIMGD